MLNVFRYLVLIFGSVLAFQAYAYENLVGEYTGTLTSVEGYSANAGDPCVVTIGRSDTYGGSLVFEISNVEKLLVKTGDVEKALRKSSGIVKLLTPGGSGKATEAVVLKRSDAGVAISLTLKLMWKQQHREQSVTCGGLVKQ